MQDNALSPDEIEALLGDAEEPRVGSGAGARPAAEARTFDLGSPQRKVREPIPALELVGVRFAHGLRRALSSFVRSAVEVDAARTTVTTYRDFLASLPERSSADVLRLRPLQGSALLAFEPGLVFATVETLFGGTPDAAAGAPAREFTPTEQRIVARLVEHACAEYRNAWQPLHPLEPEPVRSEASAAMARIVAPEDPVIATRLALRIAGAGGELHLCIPYASLEPLRETLYATVQAGEARDDRRWLNRLADRIQAADVTLVAEFARATATIEELMSLKAGDFIELGLQETITAKVDEVPVFQCRYGVSNGRYAIRIQSYLTSADTLPGGEHDR